MKNKIEIETTWRRRLIVGLVFVLLVLVVLVVLSWCDRPQSHPYPSPAATAASARTPIPPQPIVTTPPTMAPCQGTGKG